MDNFPHFSVLKAEILQAFESVNLTDFIDGTLGAGGHAQLLLENHPEIQTYLGIDQDPQALQIAIERLKRWKNQFIPQAGNFAQFDEFIKQKQLKRPLGILVDLGVSSMQLDQAERGFSFMRDGPLDMRMDPQNPLSAADIVNQWSEYELARIFRDYGEEKKWRLAASVICKARQIEPIVTTKQLVTLLSPYLLNYQKKKGIHPLTLVFQALRIAVNRELDVLKQFLDKAIESLAPGGRLAVISFHSLEDRIVKTQMRLAASDKWDSSGLGGGLFRDKKPVVALITKKPLEASDEEIALNSRSRSAKLRVIEKL
jgi:16S rRNA (cytosine1402-N4)-methyltransferase